MIGQSVFYVEDGKVLNKIITAVFAVHNDDIFVGFLYTFEFEESPSNVYSHEWYKEDRIFATKEELIASLME